jgi:tetratricopeptide (TPR) repeat protein
MMNKTLKMAILAIMCVTLVLINFSTPLFSANSSLSGTITDKATGEPLAKVKINVVYIKSRTLSFQLKTDKEGKYYKSGLRNGMFQLNFEKEGYLPTQTSIRLRPAEKKVFDTQLEVLKVKATNESLELVKAAQKLMSAGKYDDAITKITKVIEKEPGSFLLYFNRAVAYEKKGDQDNALKDYEKSLQLKADFILSLASAGKIHAKKGQFENAVKHYKKAFDLGITDTIALYNYGACLVNIGNSSDGKIVFEKLVALDPNYADAYYQLGIIYLGLNDNTKAKESMKKFLELDPKNQNASVATEILKTL